MQREQYVSIITQGEYERNYPIDPPKNALHPLIVVSRIRQAAAESFRHYAQDDAPFTQRP